MYIAFEGIDGAGKSTVVPAVAARLEADGHEIVMVREPGGTETGESIRSTLLGHSEGMSLRTEALLFAAARAQLATEVIAPALAEGKLVLSDRTVYSSLAYQGGARGLGVESVREPNAWGLDGVWPQMVVLLELDAAAGLSREDQSDRISSEGIALMATVAETYAELAAAEPEVFVVVDASRPVRDVVDDCVRSIEERL